MQQSSCNACKKMLHCSMTPLHKALLTLKRFHEDWVPCSQRNISWGNGWTTIRLMRGTFYVRGYQLQLNLNPQEFRMWMHRK